MRLTDIVTTDTAFVRPAPDVQGLREALPASLPKPVKLTTGQAACTRSRDRRRAQ